MSHRLLVRGGVRDAFPISWVADGRRRRALPRRSCARANSNGRDRLAFRTNAEICILGLRPRRGLSLPLDDPGLAEPIALDEAQRGLVAAAEWVCLDGRTRRGYRSAPEAVQPDAKLAWAVKVDARAVPADLAAAIASRADIVAFSRGEAEFVGKARASTEQRSQILIETRGREGVALSQGSGEPCLSRRCASG